MSALNLKQLTPQQKQLGLGFTALLLIWLIALFAQPVPEKVRDDYYTGPRESKNHPGIWTDADGRRVPPPPGWEEKHPHRSGSGLVNRDI